MEKKFKIERFPPSSDRSLRAWSAADEHILKFVEEEISTHSSISIINDRFGYLSVALSGQNPNIITHFRSQEDAILHNIELNEQKNDFTKFQNLLDIDDKKYDIIIIKIPKSLDLFHLILMKAIQLSHAESKIYCGFMTRHFTNQIPDLASRYYENVNQSLAWKKSRVLSLSIPKKIINKVSPIITIPFLNHQGDQQEFKQYFGVFSANHIDYATQFLLANLSIDAKVSKAMDLACGNGVIAHQIRSQSATAEIHLLDDSYLAIESAKLNLRTGINHFHYNYHLRDFEDHFFDLVVCNPPFHFEHENTIDIALKLFKGVSRILKNGGEFIIVSNLHLNYKTQLIKIFDKVEVLNMNSKFEVISCKKH